MGVQLVEVTPERVRATLVVRPDLCTTGDSMHGGAFMAFADTLGGVATYVNLPPNTRTTTIESSTKFLRGAPVGSTVQAECTGVPQGAHDDGLADAGARRRRPAVRGRHADAAGHPGVTVARIDACLDHAGNRMNCIAVITTVAAATMRPADREGAGRAPAGRLRADLRDRESSTTGTARCRTTPSSGCC
jgi:uncharacterized protein (TIGR00369 family)